MNDGTPLGKARAAKKENDLRRIKKMGKKVALIDAHLGQEDVTVTEACRKYGIATDAYYRYKHREKILTDASS